MKWIWIVAALVGCSSADKTAGFVDIQAKNDKAMETFEKANQLMDNSEFQEAAKLYDKLIVENPTNQLELIILYNSALAHLQSGDCPTAGKRFRKVLRHSKNKMSSLTGRTFLRLGDVYICLGDDNKAIVNFLEIYRNRKRFELPVEFIYAEVPAKLATAYARIGNQKEAAFYFKQAERGLLVLQNSKSTEREQAELVARTLFLMGNIANIDSNKMKPEDYFATIEALQKYLYKAVDYAISPWAEQSAEQILSAYDKTWNLIETQGGQVEEVQSLDPAIMERQKVTRQLNVAQGAINSILALYRERIPDPKEPQSVRGLIEKIGIQERKLRNFIATHIIGTGLTPEAIEATSLKRPGRVFNPNPILEKRAIQNNRKKLPKKKTLK